MEQEAPPEHALVDGTEPFRHPTAGFVLDRHDDLDALEPEEASVDELIHDIRYLHEHRLVDLEG